MHIHEEKRDGAFILRLSGRLDAMTGPVAEEHVQRAIDSDPKKLALDFSEVDYLSSAGLRILLSATKKMQNIGGACVVFSVAPKVMNVIRMAGFDKVVKIVATEQDAL